MKKSVNFNQIHITGYLVKDAWMNENGTMASFRIGHSTGKNRPSVFLGCVIFGDEENPLPVDLLKKGDKPVCLDINGHLRVKERVTVEGRKFSNLEVVVDGMEVAQTVEVEEKDAQATQEVQDNDIIELLEYPDNDLPF